MRTRAEGKGIACLTRYTSMVQRDGGSESFERFFAATKDHVYRSLLVITRDQALADDGAIKPATVAEAIAKYKIDTGRAAPWTV